MLKMWELQKEVEKKVVIINESLNETKFIVEIFALLGPGTFKVQIFL